MPTGVALILGLLDFLSSRGYNWFVRRDTHKGRNEMMSSKNEQETDNGYEPYPFQGSIWAAGYKRYPQSQLDEENNRRVLAAFTAAVVPMEDGPEETSNPILEAILEFCAARENLDLELVAIDRYIGEHPLT